MVQEMDAPQYYVYSMELDVEPEIGYREVGQVGIDFSLKNPKLKSSPEGFTCQSNLELELYKEGKAPWQVEDESESEFGEISVEMAIFVKGEQDQFKPYYTTWSEGSYEEMDRDFLFHLESGILQHVINPIGDLLANSYSGIVPKMAFTNPEIDEE